MNVCTPHGTLFVSRDALAFMQSEAAFTHVWSVRLRADVKDDDCGSSAAHFEKMRDAIAATGTTTGTSQQPTSHCTFHCYV